MNKNDVKSLIQYRNEHSGSDTLTCYNRWVATVAHKVTSADMEEACFLCSLPTHNKLNDIIKEGKI